MAETFIDYMDLSIEDTVKDLEEKVQNYEGVQVLTSDKIKIQLLKKIDLFKKRIKCFQLFHSAT